MGRWSSGCASCPAAACFPFGSARLRDMPGLLTRPVWPGVCVGTTRGACPRAQGLLGPLGACHLTTRVLAQLATSPPVLQSVCLLRVLFGLSIFKFSPQSVFHRLLGSQAVLPR